MAKEIILAASRREGSGSARAASLRRKGWLPAVLYGDQGARSVQVNTHEFEMMLTHHTGENLIVDLNVDGAVTKALLKEVQHEPVRGAPLHADFLEISMTRKMRLSIPIEFVGEPVGVSQEGGILEHALRALDVECLPADLVDVLSVDVSKLGIGDTLMVRDMTISAKFTVLTGPDVAVATVVAPRLEAEPTPAEGEAAAGEAAAAEPEVIGRKKAEGEEGAEGEAPAEKGKAEKPKAEKPKAEPAKDKEKEGKPKAKEKGK
jgi:large subunit ribosomal protein L25